MTSSIRKIVFFALLVSVAYIAYAFMFKPVNANLNAQKARVEAQMAKLQELERVTQAARDLDSQMSQLKDAISFFEAKLPPQSQIHKVLEQVTLIAQKQGLKTKTIQTLSKKDCMGYVEQPIKMELYGNFDSYYAFLLELEQLPRIAKIRQLELKKDQHSEGTTTADFVVSVFFQKQAG